MQQAVSDNQAKDIDGLTTDMDNAKISESGAKEVPTYDQQFPSLGGLGAGPLGETQPFGRWNTKPRVQASTITQVFHIPAEERKGQQEFNHDRVCDRSKNRDEQQQGQELDILDHWQA